MRICNIATPAGRIMLNDMEFKIREKGSIKTRIVKSNEEYLRLLNRYFSLTFPLDTVFNYPLEK
jgi:arylamine N-acetyltransferase